MATKERSIWKIDRYRKRLTKYYAYLPAIWTLLLLVGILHVGLYGTGIKEFEWSRTIILFILAIWFAIIGIWPGAVFALNCRMARLHPDTKSYEMEARRQLVWELRGKHLKE